MATQRQIEANRRNAAGPHQMTDAGKQAIRAMPFVTDSPSKSTSSSRRRSGLLQRNS